MPLNIVVLTRTTIELSQSLRNDFSESQIAEMRRLIHAPTERTPIQWEGMTNCTLGRATMDGGLIAIVRDHAEQRLCRIGVAFRQNDSDHIWHSVTGNRMDDRRPGPPWCLIDKLKGLHQHPLAEAHLFEFARCLAWAWLVDNGTPS